MTKKRSRWWQKGCLSVASRAAAGASTLAAILCLTTGSAAAHDPSKHRDAAAHGSVVTAGSGTLTIEHDGRVTTYVIVPETKVMRDGAKVPFGDVRPGSDVAVFATKLADGKSVASEVNVSDAPSNDGARDQVQAHGGANGARSSASDSRPGRWGRRARLVFIVFGIFALAAFGGIRWARSHGFSARVKPGRIETFIAGVARSLAIPPAVRSLKNPLEPTELWLAEGRDHFADHCATCHANDGSGKTMINSGLYPPAPDLRGPGTQSMTDGELLHVIREGVRFTGMPGFGGEDEENWKLVLFVQHLPTLSPAELALMREVNGDRF